MKGDDGKVYSYENIKTQGYLNGHAPGVDAAAEYLTGLAVELFKKGQDSAATAMRKLAEDVKKNVKPELEARAKRHEKEFPDVVVGAFEV